MIGSSYALHHGSGGFLSSKESHSPSTCLSEAPGRRSSRAGISVLQPYPQPLPHHCYFGRTPLSKLSPFQIAAAKAPPEAVLKPTSQKWFLCVNLPYVIPSHCHSRMCSLRSHIFSRSLKLCFFLLWPRHSLETPPYSYHSFFYYWSGLLSALAARETLFSVHSFPRSLRFLL